MKNLIKIVLISLLSLGQVLANSVTHISELIPLDFSRPPATDLIYKGKLISLNEAKKLQKIGIDLAGLNPKESAIWTNKVNYNALTDNMLPVSERSTIKYLSTTVSSTEKFRFNGNVSTPSGPQNITFMLSKRIHNVLLRKNLLRKLGYIIPKVKYLKNVKVAFETKLEKQEFITQLSEDTFGDSKRWVIDENPESKELVVQDLIAMSSENHIYNLALGSIPGSIIKGRRVFNALSLPYSLVEVPESVNLFSWRGGRIVSNAVRLSTDSVSDFFTSYEDAVWMLRRMKSLSKKDIQTIVKDSFFPEPVEKLIVEKICSRLNQLYELFQIPHNDLAFNSEITFGDQLVDGKINHQEWEGYGSRFTYGDPDNPLSGSEIFAFFKNKLISNLLGNLIREFNTRYMPETDLAFEIMERQKEKAKESFINFLKTGKEQKVNFGVWAVPRFGTNFIASRDVVAGSYLGTDNLVQLVDTIGLSADAGAYIGTDGMPTNWHLSGDVKATITRRYSHITPIKSMKKALKTPFHNILVPLSKRKFGAIFDDLRAGRISDLDDEKKRELLVKALEEFNESLEVGESILMTDSIGAGFNVNAGYKLTDIIKAHATFLSGQMVISRLHILRSSEDTIQVYKDIGNVGHVGLNFGLKAYIPVITINFKAAKGSAKVKFSKLDISKPNKEEEEKEGNSLKDKIRTVQALRHLLLHNSTELVNLIDPPYVLKHNFVEKERGLTFLLWNWKKQITTNTIRVAHPDGNERKFYKRLTGKRKGRNYEQLAVDTINALIDENSDTEVIIDSASNGTPGDTFLGKQVSRTISMEGEMKGEAFKTPFIKLNYLWKGWKISAKKVKEIISKINRRFNYPFYDPLALHSTESLKLYNVNLNFYIYKNAIKALMTHSKDDIYDIFAAHADLDLPSLYGSYVINFNDNDRDDEARKLARSFYRYQKKAKKYLKKNDMKKYTKYVSRIVSIAEASLSTKGLKVIFGGEENFYIHSKIGGFREGDENGDKPYQSSSLGEVGSRYFEGPLRSVQNQLGMTESEFSIYWLLGRL